MIEVLFVFKHLAGKRSGAAHSTLAALLSALRLRRAQNRDEFGEGPFVHVRDRDIGEVGIAPAGDVVAVDRLAPSPDAPRASSGSSVTATMCSLWR